MALFLAIATVFVWSMVRVEYAKSLEKGPSKPINVVQQGDGANSSASVIDDSGRIIAPSNASHFVPILMYHYIRDYVNLADPLGEQLSVSPATFAKQMTQLQKLGYQTMSLTDFAAGKFPEKPLIITFDDGYDDQFTNALPILEQKNLTATFFIIGNFVGRANYMTKDQIATLKNKGMEVGGHSLTHRNLATTEYELQVSEIAGSLVGRDKVFCYPSGKYNAVTLDIVSGLDVKAAVTTNLGIATDRSPIYELPRIRVKEKTDLAKVITEELAIAKRQIPPSHNSNN